MQESRGKFEERFFKLLVEDISTGDGALGTAAASSDIYNPATNINSADTYAPGTAVKPKMLGSGTQTRSGYVSKKKAKKAKKKIKGINFGTGKVKRVKLPGENEEDTHSEREKQSNG